MTTYLRPYEIGRPNRFSESGCSRSHIDGYLFSQTAVLLAFDEAVFLKSKRTRKKFNAGQNKRNIILQ